MSKNSAGSLIIFSVVSAFLLFCTYEFYFEEIFENYFHLRHIENFTKKFEDLVVVALILFITSLTSLKISRDRFRYFRRLTCREEILRQIAFSANDAIVIVDDKSHIAFWNRAAESIFGFSEEVVGSYFIDLLFKEKDRSFIGRCINSCSARSAEEIAGAEHWVAVSKDGREVPVEVTLASISANNDSYTLLIMRDESEKMGREKHLYLEKEKALRAAKEKDKYMELIAYDLKEPIAGIVSFLMMMENTLKENPDDPITKQYAAPLGLMLKSGEYAVEMIDNILHLSQFLTGKFEVEKTFLNSRNLASFAISLHQQMADKKGVVLINDIPEESRLYADKVLFLEVLNNLVSDAVKFCRKHDVVKVTLPDDGTGGICVSDTGIGIDGKMLDSLFLSDRKSKHVCGDGERGAGVGLQISLEIMKAHEGSLSVLESSVNKTTFCALLPQKIPHCLISCDGDMRVCAFVNMLEKLGSKIENCASRTKLEECLENNIPDIVISAPLGGDNHKDAVTSVGKMMQGKDVPVVICPSEVRCQCGIKLQELDNTGESDYPELSPLLVSRVREFLG